MMPVRYTANLAILFAEVPFLVRFACATVARFTHGEFWFSYKLQVSTLARRIALKRFAPRPVQSCARRFRRS